jgi:coenzyme F420 biosynthesis associated uncharacterized protein
MMHPEAPLHWESATAAGVRLVPPGPRVPAREATAAIRELYALAARAEGLVADTARIAAPSNTAPVVVVDRTAWLRHNVESMRTIIPGQGQPTVTGRVAGAEIGSVLAWLSTKVLGQFDIFAPVESVPHGRLMLVAPNIVHAETELRVDPRDFRLWVCLHEETHRVQFTAHPWLRDYLRDQAEVVTGLTDLGTPAMGDLARMVTGRGDHKISLLDLLPDTEHVRSTIERVTAVMSLLEGHADVIMDRVGPEVIGSIAQIRSRFEHRRDSHKGVDRVLRRVLGLELKLAQYRDGAKFCNQVIAALGIDGLNRVFVSPNTLPTLAEIHDPELWITRMTARSR